MDGTAFLLDWYRANGIENIGFEDPAAQYDENGRYIGKGPIGYYEVLCAMSNVARRMQNEGLIADKFGRIPVIVHDLEYAWYVEKATRNANPNGEADAFLTYLHDTQAAFHRERPAIENTEAGEGDTDAEIEAFLTSAYNAELHSADDVIGVLDQLLSFMGGDDEDVGAVQDALDNLFKDIGDAADKK